VIDQKTADRLYNNAIQNLQGAILGHVIKGRMAKTWVNGVQMEMQAEPSIKGFCETYGIDRANLQKAFSRTTDKDLGVGTYQRCCAALGLIPESCIISSHPQIFNLSLRHFLMIDAGAIKDSILMLQEL
jgi:hypothetical protein